MVPFWAEREWVRPTVYLLNIKHTARRVLNIFVLMGFFSGVEEERRALGELRAAKIVRINWTATMKIATALHWMWFFDRWLFCCCWCVYARAILNRNSNSHPTSAREKRKVRENITNVKKINWLIYTLRTRRVAKVFLALIRSCWCVNGFFFEFKETFIFICLDLSRIISFEQVAEGVCFSAFVNGFAELLVDCNGRVRWIVIMKWKLVDFIQCCKIASTNHLDFLSSSLRLLLFIFACTHSTSTWM